MTALAPHLAISYENTCRTTRASTPVKLTPTGPNCCCASLLPD